jgi:hypothetical protein
LGQLFAAKFLLLFVEYLAQAIGEQQQPFAPLHLKFGLAVRLSDPNSTPIDPGTSSSFIIVIFMKNGETTLNIRRADERGHADHRDFGVSADQDSVATQVAVKHKAQASFVCRLAEGSVTAPLSGLDCDRASFQQMLRLGRQSWHRLLNRSFRTNSGLSLPDQRKANSGRFRQILKIDARKGSQQTEAQPFQGRNHFPAVVPCKRTHRRGL